MYTVSITSQGQISIPSKIRRELGLKKRGKAIVKVEGGRLLVEPIMDFLELGGSLTTSKPPLSLHKIHKKFAESLVRIYSRKRK